MKHAVLFILMIAGCAARMVPDASEAPSVPETPATPIEYAAEATSLLPLEVMGPNGTIASLTLPARSADAQTLYLKSHSISYPDHLGYPVSKASIRLNGGAWVDINNVVATCEYPESAYDCVVGPYATVRFSIQLHDLGVIQAGDNQVDFRFNYQPGDISSGYRILDIELRDANGQSLVPENALAYDDPAQWQPITTDAGRLANGKRLYEARNVLTDGPGAPIITASCADCHVAGGRDLKYFAYSDHSIIARSVFHGLTEREGEDIASYVRVYELTDAQGNAYDPPGTPWDPPYQPGPGLDSQPVHEWAAGAGLDWVLDDEAEMLPHLFPDLTNLESVIHIDSTLNRRELPIAFQLPDWNEWIPIIHPLDLWPEMFENSEAWQGYEGMLADAFATPGERERMIASGKADDVFDRQFKAVLDFVRKDGPANLPGNWTRQRIAKAMLGVYQWNLVKTWEVMHTYHLEDIAPRLYPDGEPRSWIGQSRALFNVAPHIHGASKGIEGDIENTYFDTGWYEAQVILNAGNRETSGMKPVDWKYHFSHIGDWKKATGEGHGLRYIAAYLKVIQNGHNRFGTQMPNGFYLRHTTPAWIDGLAMGDGGKNALYGLDEIHPGLKRDLAEAFVGALVDKMSRHAVEDWPRGSGHHFLEDAAYIPRHPEGRERNRLFDRISYADHFYRIIPIFAYMGVDSHVLRELADWGEATWPQGEWDQLLETSDWYGAIIEQQAARQQRQRPDRQGNKPVNPRRRN